jgi:hypothetical protein
VRDDASIYVHDRDVEHIRKNARLQHGLKAGILLQRGDRIGAGADRGLRAVQHRVGNLLRA